MAVQANYVANLFGGAQIESCIAPYYCESCRKNQMMLVHASELDSVPPQRSCPKCSSPLIFDELDEYFRFLIRR